MAFWHRWTKHDETVDEHVTDPAHLPAVRTERALVALAVHAGQIEERIHRLEARVEAMAESDIGYATHDDLLDIRLHGAKLAGEIARLNMELRSEIEQAFEKAKALGTPTAHQNRVAQLAESIIDLSDRLYEAAPAPEDHIDQAV